MITPSPQVTEHSSTVIQSEKPPFIGGKAVVVVVVVTSICGGKRIAIMAGPNCAISDANRVRIAIRICQGRRKLIGLKSRIPNYISLNTGVRGPKIPRMPCLDMSLVNEVARSKTPKGEPSSSE